MAGDWIKMRTALADDPAVIRIAASLDCDEYDVVGRLHALWSWADRQLERCNAFGVTPAFINRLCRAEGFAEAVAEAGWLRITEEGVEFPNYEDHLSKGAKNRSLTAKRTAKTRSKPLQKSNKRDAECNGQTATEIKAREEKRREDLKPPISPPEGDGVCVGAEIDLFGEWFAAYPRQVGEDKAQRAYRSALKRIAVDRGCNEIEAAALLLDRTRAFAASPKGQGKYCPYPARWLDDGRWRDDPADWGRTEAPTPESREDADAAFENARKCLRRYAGHMDNGQPEKFWAEMEVLGGPKLRQVVESLGGYAWLKQMTEFNREQKRTAFVAAFGAMP